MVRFDESDDASSSRVSVGGVPFDPLTADQMLDRVRQILKSEGQHRIAFANPEFVMEARRSQFMMDYLRSCDLVAADGIGILWAARVLRRGDLPERITGTEFVPRLCELLSQIGLSIYFLGGRPEVADRAVARLRLAFPGLVVAGSHHGYFELDSNVIEQINSASADVVMVCLGNPAQELWIHKNLPQLGCKLAFGNGGALDFWSGDVPLAPNLVQRSGLEWFFRLLTNPSWQRVRRQLNLARYAALVMAGRF